VEVILDEEDELRVPSPQGVELLNWEEHGLIELINGTYSEWKSVVEYCLGEGATEPDFEDYSSGLEGPDA